MKKSLKYVPTQTKLAEVLGIDRAELNKKWLNRAGWPPKTAYGWDVQACHDFHKAEKDRQIQSTAGINSDVKRRKLLAEAEKAELDVKERMGQLVDQNDYIANMLQLAEIYKSAFVEFRQWMVALYPDPAVANKMVELENLAHKRIREYIDEQSRSIKT